MKLFKTHLLTFFIVAPITVFAQNYETDRFENYVADQDVQAAIKNAQEILCQVANLGTKSLVNDGAYLATQTKELCDQSGKASGSSDGTTATTTTTAATAATATTSTATGAEGVAAADVTEYTVTSEFDIEGMQQTSVWINNTAAFDERTNPNPKSVTYARHSQSSSPDDISKFGDWVLKFQQFTSGNVPADFEGTWAEDACSEEAITYGYSWCNDGNDIGRGTMVASGNEIQYKGGTSSGQDNLAAEFLPNGDVRGVFTRWTGWQDESLRDLSCEGADDWWACQPQAYKDSSINVLGEFNFGRSKEDKTFCTVLSNIYSIDWNVRDEETGEVLRVPYELTADGRRTLGERAGWNVDELCYSIDATDSIKNIWDYGVYTEDGAKFSQANPSFPLKAIIDVDGVEKRVHGWAAYWGVHVNEEFHSLITDTTPFKRDDLSKDDLRIDNIFNLKPRAYRIEKTEKIWQALNELDKINIQFWTRDEWWFDEFRSLGFINTANFTDRITFKSNKASLTDYDNGTDASAYSMYGEHDGASTLNANLVGAKLDKTNLAKIIADNPSDPGKVMNFSFLLEDLPTNWTNRTITPRLFLCTGSSITNTSKPYGSEELTLAPGQACLYVEGGIKVSSDGTNITIAYNDTNENNNIYMKYFDSSGLVMQPTGGAWTPNDLSKFFTIQKTGINQEQLYLNFNFSKLMSKFGAVLEQGGKRDPSLHSDLATSIEGFLNSSDSFTFLAYSEWINMFTHDGKQFNKIKGTFEVADEPPVAVFVDDISVKENDGTISVPLYLSEVSATDVTIDYAISVASTAAASDYADLAAAGTITIPAGASSANLTVSMVEDGLVESIDDETIVLTFSNATNASLGRTSSTISIYDIDMNRTVYDEYAGAFDATTQLFTISEGITHNPYAVNELAKPITFTPAEWMSKMRKVWNEGTEWERVEIREMGVWSHDTQTYYRIRESALSDPTASAVGAGVSSEQRTTITAADLPTTLYCFEECLTTALIKTHYDDALAQIVDGASTVANTSPSPMADIGPYAKSDISVDRVREAGTENQWTENYTRNAGDHLEGQILADIYTYTVVDGALVDEAGVPLQITSDFSSLTRPGESLRGARYTNRWGDERDTNWGLDVNGLVDATTLALTECEKDGSDGSYIEWHPVYLGDAALTTRYCSQKRWSDQITTTYSVRLETNKQFEIFTEAGTRVVLDPPQRFKLQLPNEAAFGSDAGKTFVLDVDGGRLNGIPGNVINVDTGENLGDWVPEWANNYRWVQRFVIPDGTLINASTGSTTLKTKALRGEEWLLRKDSAIGSMPTLLDYDLSKLLTDKAFDFEIGPRPVYYWGCDSNQNGIVNEREEGSYNAELDRWISAPIDICYIFNENGEWIGHIEDENGDPIYTPNDPKYATATQLTLFVLERSFNSCTDQLAYELERWAAEMNMRNDNDPNKLSDWRQDENFANWYSEQLERCQTIGAQPAASTLMNDGNPSVVDGAVVYDPST